MQANFFEITKKNIFTSTVYYTYPGVTTLLSRQPAFLLKPEGINPFELIVNIKNKIS